MADTKEQQTEMKIERKPWLDRLIEDVTTFKEKTGMEYTTIGMKAIGNARFWERLQDGGNITVRKADELYFWMATKGFIFNS
jgi:hypothetical protein